MYIFSPIGFTETTNIPKDLVDKNSIFLLQTKSCKVVNSFTNWVHRDPENIPKGLVDKKSIFLLQTKCCKAVNIFTNWVHRDPTNIPKYPLLQTKSYVLYMNTKPKD